MEKEREQRCVRTKARARKTIGETRRQRHPRPIDRLSNKEFYYQRLLVERMAFVLETDTVARESIRELLETFYEYITCAMRNIFKLHFTLQRDPVVMHVLVKFETDITICTQVT